MMVVNFLNKNASLEGLILFIVHKNKDRNIFFP